MAIQTNQEFRSTASPDQYRVMVESLIEALESLLNGQDYAVIDALANLVGRVIVKGSDTPQEAGDNWNKFAPHAAECVKDHIRGRGGHVE